MCPQGDLKYGSRMRTTGGLGLRGRQRESLRRRIHDSALQLFEDKGFEETTIAEIAEAAETSPRTVFRHFGSKEELVFMRSSGMLTYLRELLASRPRSETPYQALKAAMCDFAERLESEKTDAMRRMGVIAQSPTLQRRQAEVREEYIQGLAQEVAAREGSARVTLEHQAVTLSAFGALSVAWDYWQTSSLPDLLDRAFRSIEGELVRP